MLHHPTTIHVTGFTSTEIEVISHALTTHMPQIHLSNDIKNASLSVNANETDEKPLKIGCILDFFEKKLSLNRINSDLHYKKYSFYPKNMIFTLNSYEILLNEREADLVIALVQAGDKGCTREELLNTIWGYRSDLETHAVETQIYRLRQKIEQDTGLKDILLTIDGTYKLS